jgi:hypothetical protein
MLWFQRGEPQPFQWKSNLLLSIRIVRYYFRRANGGSHVKLYVYEGSPKEIAEVSLLMDSNSVNKRNTAGDEESAAEEAKPSEDLTVAQIRSVFERRSLAKPLINMLKLLYEAGEERISSDSLKKVLGYNSHEFRGMLGAFGRRLKNTSGIPEGVKLFDEHWDDDLRQKTWTLPTNVRKAVEELGIV